MQRQKSLKDKANVGVKGTLLTKHIHPLQDVREKIVNTLSKDFGEKKMEFTLTGIDKRKTRKVFLFISDEFLGKQLHAATTHFEITELGPLDYQFFKVPNGPVVVEGNARVQELPEELPRPIIDKDTEYWYFETTQVKQFA